jgi:hypothetical protein
VPDSCRSRETRGLACRARVREILRRSADTRIEAPARGAAGKLQVLEIEKILVVETTSVDDAATIDQHASTDATIDVTGPRRRLTDGSETMPQDQRAEKMRGCAVHLDHVAIG